MVASKDSAPGLPGECGGPTGLRFIENGAIAAKIVSSKGTRILQP